MYCAKCGKPIRFIRMQNEKSMPVDEDMVYVIPDERGSIQALTIGGRSFRARPGHCGQNGAVKAYRSHWPNCTRSTEPKKKAISQAEWRKKQEESRPCRMPKTSFNHPHGDPTRKAKAASKPESEQMALF